MPSRREMHLQTPRSTSDPCTCLQKGELQNQHMHWQATVLPPCATVASPEVNQPYRGSAVLHRWRVTSSYKRVTAFAPDPVKRSCCRAVPASRSTSCVIARACTLCYTPLGVGHSKPQGMSPKSICHTTPRTRWCHSEGPSAVSEVRTYTWHGTFCPMAGWLHGVCVGGCFIVFPLCGFSLSLFCNYTFCPMLCTSFLFTNTEDMCPLRCSSFGGRTLNGTY